MLCRGDIALPLSDDHKAAREDETVSLAPLWLPGLQPAVMLISAAPGAGASCDTWDITLQPVWV